MFKNILIAVDGSEHGRKSARIGGDLARYIKSEVWLVTAFDPVPSYLEV